MSTCAHAYRSICAWFVPTGALAGKVKDTVEKTTGDFATAGAPLRRVDRSEAAPPPPRGGQAAEVDGPTHDAPAVRLPPAGSGVGAAPQLRAGGGSAKFVAGSGSGGAVGGEVYSGESAASGFLTVPSAVGAAAGATPPLSGYVHAPTMMLWCGWVDVSTKMLWCWCVDVRPYLWGSVCCVWVREDTCADGHTCRRTRVCLFV